jgi:hypothetical protein
MHEVEAGRGKMGLGHAAVLHVLQMDHLTRKPFHSMTDSLHWSCRYLDQFTLFPC